MNLPDFPRLAALQVRLLDQARRAWASAVLLFAFFWIVASAGFSGGIQKHGMPDGARGGGIEVMLDASAKKPYVYRQFSPQLANFLDRTLPSSLKEAISAAAAPERTFARTVYVTKPEFRFRYICVYYISFLALFASLFALRRILLDYGLGKGIAMAVPAIFVLAFPYLQTGGGYYYDQVELCFLALAYLAALRGRLVPLAIVSMIATLNKEAFFFFVPALFPLLFERVGRKRALLGCATAILASGLVNAAMKLLFFDAPGAAAEFKLFRNILNYLNPLTYLQFENTYGIAGPAGVFAGTLLVAAIVALRGWGVSPLAVRRHMLLAACLNLPLFLAFCATGELRNLSLLFVGFVVLGAHALRDWLRAQCGAPPAVQPAAPDPLLARQRH